MTSHDRLPVRTAEIPEQIALRPLASPLPIGLLALAVGSFVLAGEQLQWLAVAQSEAVAVCLLAFVVPLQFTSFVFAVLSRDEGAASGLAVLSGTWAGTGVIGVISAPGRTSGALGLLLVAAAAALAIPASATIASKPAMTVILVVVAGRFAVTGAYELGASAAWQTVAGVIGVVVSAIAVVAAIAFALEAAHHGPVLPTLRAPGSPAPRRESSDSPAAPVQYESGVRPKL